MRILVLIHEYPPIGGGGGSVAQDLSRGFVKVGHEVLVLTMGWGDLPGEKSEEGITVRRLDCGRKQPFKASLGNMLRYVWAAFWSGLAAVRGWKPDVIQVHFAVPAGAAAWALHIFTGVPYLLTVHLGDVPGGVPEKTSAWFSWVRPFTPAIWKKASRVVAISEFTRGLAERSYAVPMTVIPNGVNTADLDPGRIAVGRPPRIIFAGRFVVQKNPLMIVNALSNLADLPWSCTLLGDGPMREVVEESIKRVGLEKRFLLPGWVTPEEVIEGFRSSDILMMPSLSEGLPVVGVQALSLGLAMVLSRVGGNIELVKEGVNGYLLDPQDQAGFATTLAGYLGDHALLLKARMASRALAANFDLSISVNKYLSLLAEAASVSALSE